MKKHFSFIGILSALLASLSSCNLADLSGITEQSVIEQIYSEYKNNGGTLDYSDWLLSIKGEKGDPGEPGQKGEDGADGKDGIDGQTPYIGENGNWWIGDVDTGISVYNSNQTNTDNLEQFEFYLLNDGTYAIGAGGSLFLDEILIPDTFNGRPVTQIIYCGFVKCQASSIVFGSNVKKINTTAFAECKNLQTVDFKNTEIIGYGAFRSCTNISDIFIPKTVKQLNAWCFSWESENFNLIIENDDGNNNSTWTATESLSDHHFGYMGDADWGEPTCSATNPTFNRIYSQDSNSYSSDFYQYTWVRQ